MKRVFAVIVAALAFMPAPARPADGSKDMKVQLPLTDGTYVSGVLKSVDDQKIVLKVGGETRQIPLEQVKPIGLYLAKKRMMRDDDAPAHMELGRFLLKHGEEGLARKELVKAVRIDPSLKEEAQKLLESGGASQPKGPQDEDPTGQTKPPPKKQQAEKENYVKATPAQIAANNKKADDYAAKAKMLAPAMHLVESEHFRIFTAWPSSRDSGLASVCEKMYRACCQQFEIDPKENIFAGKCPVLVFWEKEQFEQFCAAIGNSSLAKAAGYAGSGGGGFVYIVMNANRNYAPFCEVLVHEGTHAFMSRYGSGGGHIPSWVNEGVADLVVSSVLTRSWAARKHRKAAMRAMQEKADIRHVFRTIRLDGYDYGLAQSLVRFMIAKDRQGFANFIKLLKKRKPEAEALKETFGWTHDELVKNWMAAVPKMYGQ